MPISIEYDTEKKTVFSKAAGPITREDIMSYLSAVERMDLPSEYSVLADYRDAELTVSCNDIRTVVEKRQVVGSEHNRIRIALVASKNVTYGLTRVFGTLMNEEKCEVHSFRNRDEAENWLGL